MQSSKLILIDLYVILTAVEKS